MEAGNFSIKKEIVECYKIRHSTGKYWADITIDAKEQTGRIQIASDFGSYQNYWGACGCNFKDFLAKLDIEYAAGKFGANKHFDSEKTLKNFKASVLEYRRNGDMSKENARDIFNEIKELEEYIYENEFYINLNNSHALMRFFDWCPHLSYSIHPQFINFWKYIWPVLLQEFEKGKNHE
jgi:hypothetical protein